LAQRAADGNGSVVEERRALVEYREHFEELLGDSLPDVSLTQSIAQTGQSKWHTSTLKPSTQGAKNRTLNDV